MGQATLHPRLLARQEQLGRALGVDDPTELVQRSALSRLVAALRLSPRVRPAEREHPSHGARVGSESGPRGRPPGSANWASRQLGLGLATLWFEQRGSQPTRRFDAYGSGRPHGPYRDFVAMIWRCCPRSHDSNARGTSLTWITSCASASMRSAKRKPRARSPSGGAASRVNLESE